MSQPPSSAGSLVGQRLGNYELLALLALGGTAEIYLARITTVAGFEKYVVVKCLHDHLADDVEFVRMFLDEARLGAQLDHSNVVHTLELGEHRGRYYMVMEYLAGLSMSLVARKVVERVPGGKLPMDLTLGLLAQACGGLHYAHQRTGGNGQPLNIVHRDVSPQNLVVSFEGVLKVVDFGIAKASQRDTRTQSGTIKGKFAYMSPEQCLGGQIDHRTDIFALGIILHEFLTGRRLFKRQSAYDTYHAILECKVPPPSHLNHELDPTFDELVLKALAYEPDKRYPTAEAFGDAMLNMLHRRGRAVAPGMVAQFFEQYFGREIAEYGQRMRELVAGRAAVTLDEWDDDGDSDVAEMGAAQVPSVSSGAGASPSRASAGSASGAGRGMSSPSKQSVAPSGDTIDLTAESEDVQEEGEDDGGGATRIELNPLEAARVLHEHVTGQVVMPEYAAKLGAKGSQPAQPPARSSTGSQPAQPPARSSTGSQPAQPRPAGSPSTGQQSAVGSRGASNLPSPVEAIQRRSGRPMSTADGIPSPLETSQRSGPSSAKTLYVAPGITPGGAPPAPERSDAAHAPTGKSPPIAAAPVATLDTQPGDLGSTGRSDSGGLSSKPASSELLRTLIADTSGEPAAPPAPERPQAGQSDPALLRTQIADSGATPMPLSQPEQPYQHGYPAGIPDGSGDSAELPANSSGPSAVPYGGLLDQQGNIPSMPPVAQPMGTATHAALAARQASRKKPMPPWLLGLVFVVVVGASLGVTMLIANFL